MQSYRTVLPGVRSAKAVYGGTGAFGKLLFPAGHETHGTAGKWRELGLIQRHGAVKRAWVTGEQGPRGLHLSGLVCLSCKMKALDPCSPDSIAAAATKSPSRVRLFV